MELYKNATDNVISQIIELLANNEENDSLVLIERLHNPIIRERAVNTLQKPYELWADSGKNNHNIGKK